MEYKNAIYAGTFDPFTNGHKDIVSKAIKTFDSLTICVAKSPTKTPFITLENRVQMLKDLYKKESKIKVVSWDGLIVDFAKKYKIGTIIRGLRPTGDFENEYQMAAMNNKLFPEIQTVFFMTGGDVNYISSSLVREIYGHGGDVSDFLPAQVMKYLKKKGSK